MKKILTRTLTVLLFVIAIASVSYTAYQYNWFGVHDWAVTKQQANKVTTEHKKINKVSERYAIRDRIMHQTQNDVSKQGFVSIPKVGILEPVFDDAYSEKGLKAGANYANRSAQDPNGKQVPVMGQGNYGLASHNFDDGLTGFSGLQQHYKDDAPYLVDGERKDNKWLNGKAIYLANHDGIYEYKINNQHLVDADDVSVLNQTKRPQVTIITCLFPSTQYRIITTGYLKKTYTWEKSPSRIINYFDLTKQQTNAHADWYNPGTEEGSNGDAGGTKNIK